MGFEAGKSGFKAVEAEIEAVAICEDGGGITVMGLDMLRPRLEVI